MSLLNDVLKDLDDRKNQDPDVALIQQSSIGAQFTSNQDRKRKLIGASLVGGVLLLIGLAVFMMTGGESDAPTVAAPFADATPAQEAEPSVISAEPAPVQAVSTSESGGVPRVSRMAPESAATKSVSKEPPQTEIEKPQAVAAPAKATGGVPRFAAGEPSLNMDAATERVTVAPVAMAPRVEARPKVAAPAPKPVVATPVSRPAPKPAPKPRSTYSANTAPSGQSSQPSTSWSNPQRTSSYTRSAPPSEASRVVTRPRSGPRGIQRLYELDLAARAEAEKLIQLGETQQAELILRQFLTQQPQAQLSRGALAGLMLQMNRAEEAEQVLMGGVAQQPEGRATIKLLARAHMGRDDAEGALRLLDANSVPISEDPEYHSLRAALYQRTGRHEGAVRTYRSLLAEYPPQPAWWVGLAISLESQGQRRDAIAAYRQARDDEGGKPALKSFAAQRIAALTR